jgi:hypothetical protein
MLRISPSAFGPRCLFSDLEHGKTIIFFYGNNGAQSQGPSASWNRSTAAIGFTGNRSDAMRTKPKAPSEKRRLRDNPICDAHSFLPAEPRRSFTIEFN